MTVLGSNGGSFKIPSINVIEVPWYLAHYLQKNTQRYPEIPRNTGKYPRVKKISENTRSYILLLLPNLNPTSYLVFFPISHLILKNPTRLALVSNCYSWKTWWSSHDRYLSHYLYGAAQNNLKTLFVANHGFNFEGLLSHLWGTIIGQSDKHKLSAFLSSSW